MNKIIVPKYLLRSVMIKHVNQGVIRYAAFQLRRMSTDNGCLSFASGFNDIQSAKKEAERFGLYRNKASKKGEEIYGVAIIQSNDIIYNGERLYLEVAERKKSRMLH